MLFLKPEGGIKPAVGTQAVDRHTRLWQVSAAGPDFIFITDIQENISFLKAASEHGCQSAQLIPQFEIQIIILCHSFIWGEERKKNKLVLKFCCK